MFTADMIAPCGLDCSLCRHALEDDPPCPGCLGPDEGKMAFCVSGCGIVLCEKRRRNGYRFCDECPDFPCADVKEKESRYAVKYPLRESPLRNLRMIRELGMNAFLEKEKALWTCAYCDRPICVQTGRCSGCGRPYGKRKKDRERYGAAPRPRANGLPEEEMTGGEWIMDQTDREQIERIRYYEDLLNGAVSVVENLQDALDAFDMAQEAIRELEAYYTGDAWKEDFAASEAGALPEGLRCGVLSEDGIDHLLDDNADLLSRVGAPEQEEEGLKPEDVPFLSP